MKRFPRLGLPTSNFPEPISQRLNMYALAAGAAGVGILGSAHPAQARIVYTPSNIPIVVNGGFAELDLNHDGIKDFQFYNSYQGPSARRPPEGNNGAALRVSPAQSSNRVWAVESKGGLAAAALPKGTKVGARRPFQPGHSSLVMAAYVGGTSGTAFGPWLKVKRAFLGLKFVINGKTHFGWARIRIGGSGVGFPATITGYAYETVPDKPIITGQTKGPDTIGAGQPISLSAPRAKTATLGLLALGAPTLSIWRREESATNRQ
jgi:hypothetical protein